MGNNYHDKVRGMLVGLAVGDALGTPVEFGYTSQDIIALGEEIEHFHESYRGGAGEWSDDTSMALCIADSLLAKHGYDSYDIMNRFYRWAKEGYRSHNGLPADDVGFSTRRAITLCHRNPILPRTEPKNDGAGNGPIIRLAPIVIANTFLSKGDSEISEDDIRPVIEMARLSCRETHNSIAAEATIEMFAMALYYTLNGYLKNDIVTYCSKWLTQDEYAEFFRDNAENLVGRALEKDGSKFKELGGYIVDAFAIALWGFINFDTFEDGALAVIRLGGDTDSNAAVYGQLAGAYYGYDAIPEEWRKGVYLADELVDIADELLEMPKCPIIRTRFEDDEHFAAPDSKGEEFRANNSIQDVNSIIQKRLKSYK